MLKSTDFITAKKCISVQRRASGSVSFIPISGSTVTSQHRGFRRSLIPDRANQAGFMKSG
ncbi:hypothetical protein CN156_13955 [Sinorhizobium meliloti]|nr:hypothetical protein CN156_13955 [Sinorhizobium meliloti]